MSTEPRISRRSLLGCSAAAIGSWAVPASFSAFSRRAQAAAPPAGFGPLSPVRDQLTGLELLQLPEGFRYISFSWKGDLMSDGTPTPGNHDGMGVIRIDGDVVTLVRNHESSDSRKPFSSQGIPYDSHALGGCTNLQFDVAAGKWLKSWTSLIGTARNCAGGVTPWGTWLSCEETVVGPGRQDESGRNYLYQKDHGFVFEVPHTQVEMPVPLMDMGRFVHEALAVDPATGFIYQTEDAGNAGFYRFIPNQTAQLVAGGRLQMMRVAGHLTLKRGVSVGEPLKVTWVDIADPTRAHTPGTTDGSGVFTQGKIQEGTAFARLEGCWYGNDSIFIVSTSGGNARDGQVFRYSPKDETITLIFESPSTEVLDSPDNITVSPRGGIVLCEDGDHEPQRLHGLTPAGEIFNLAANNMILKAGDYERFEGDFRKQEWCGATFSPDGRWLFANLQTPGVTVAITGPWEKAGL
ncbi:alkaline phosphatase PhoX [Planctomicrobium sp. SH527]|uniref:alkaline phosphatase PhoX n=1 Tax=Planctomicrobium sp. SH527 TaxID=3448123 RepID=UPI003F5CB713